MVKKLPREVVGRRTRPAKAALSRDMIVSKALEILEQDGVGGLSLRRVATALDTGAASLYVYLANLGELYALMLDQALGAVSPPQDSSLGWRERLREYLSSYFHVLEKKRGLAHLAMSTIATGPNSLRMWEVLLSLLKEGRIDDARMIWAADMLLLHVTTIAAEESNRREIGQDYGRLLKALQDAPAEQFPLVTHLHQKGLFSGDDSDDDVRFGWALDVMIDGILSNQTSQ